MSLGGSGFADTEVKNRFLGFLLWKSVQSTAIYVHSKSLLSLFTPNPFTPLSGFLVFLAFHLSFLLFSFSLFATPQPHRPTSFVDLAEGLIRLVFVSGGQPLPPDFCLRAKISLSFVLFVAASPLFGFLLLLCVCWNCFDDGLYYCRRLGRLGFR
ncbi:Serine/threonine-protein kinase [Actinidia chinensis var. chinensis]|uniref:Serine/threonine-protein kinase n=1 Tax=Actinidia chinensis var. chinensis TaxID=1590841 RepID=A0A2R6QHD4_ACTCC|nr:Serine/threonine-protein kinase [Actinidia chinensis var. chinensis]